MRHLIDEFIRVALSFPGVFFSLTHNGQEVFHLEKGSLKQRIVQILGAQYNAKLVSVQENTDYLNIYGFVGKPETAKKTRGDQYFFVNNRFIRSAYLNHAVMTAFQQMIPGDSFPLYVLFIEIDPSRLDINVHPTKQEIKFEDEKIVYAFVQAAVKHALAQFSITPSLDFDLDPAIQRLDAINKPVSEEMKTEIESSSLFKTFTRKNQAHFIEPADKSDLAHWRNRESEDENFARSVSGAPSARIGETLPGNQAALTDQAAADQILHTENRTAAEQTSASFQSLYARFSSDPLFRDQDLKLSQLQNTYILCETDGGFLLIHQQAAHERVM